MTQIVSKVYHLLGPKDLVMKSETLDTDQLREHEVIGETHYSAISPGTEYAAYIGMPPLRPGKVYPRLMGYCHVSQITHTGSQVTNLSPGDMVLTFQSHRTHVKFQDSDFFIKLPGEHAAKLTPAYLYHLGYHALITGEARQGHNIGVIGGGTLGYTSARMSEISGAKTFLFSNIEGLKEKLRMPGCEVLKKSSEALNGVADKTHGVGLDIVINTSNLWSDWLFALQLANRGGTIVNMGFPGRGQENPDFNPLDPRYVYDKQLNIKALNNINETGLEPYEQRFNVRRNLEHIIDMILKGKLNSDNIITDTIHYTELDAQYLKYASRNHYLLSTLIQWKN
ncbi:MAG: hypothetical protein HEP71_28580 [Roseivirga sp.]|nr:hypothetical protein [Roseivirga sp.]